jgi:hypothetical protein
MLRGHLDIFHGLRSWPVAAPSPRVTTDIREIVLENRLLSRKFAVDGVGSEPRIYNLLTGESIIGQLA